MTKIFSADETRGVQGLRETEREPKHVPQIDSPAGATQGRGATILKNDTPWGAGWFGSRSRGDWTLFYETFFSPDVSEPSKKQVRRCFMKQTRAETFENVSRQGEFT